VTGAVALGCELIRHANSPSSPFIPTPPAVIMALNGAATTTKNGEVVGLQAEIAKYEAERAALIEKEKSLRHGLSPLPPPVSRRRDNALITASTDHAFRQRLTPTAKKAAAIVSNIRVHEAKNVWTKVEDEEGDVFPGMCFTLAKERMENSMLWKIVKQFPKGALLHAHLEAMVDSG
jgi:adenosine deaminase CECR1